MPALTRAHIPSIGRRKTELKVRPVPSSLSPHIPPMHLLKRKGRETTGEEGKCTSLRVQREILEASLRRSCLQEEQRCAL
jgi:hypothetical protein